MLKNKDFSRIFILIQAMKSMLYFIQIISVIFQLYTYMILIRIFATWIPEINNSRFVQWIAFYVDPYLNLFRQIIPPLGMIDISPIVAMFALFFIEKIVLQLLVVFL